MSKFNESSRGGLAFLQDKGIIESATDRECVANLLKSTTLASKKVLGGFISKRGNEAILDHFMDSFDFTDKRAQVWTRPCALCSRRSVSLSFSASAQRLQPLRISHLTTPQGSNTTFDTGSMLSIFSLSVDLRPENMQASDSDLPGLVWLARGGFAGSQGDFPAKHLSSIAPVFCLLIHALKLASTVTSPLMLHHI